MKVLLFGEYNRAQWNIKKGLEELGHQALVVSTRDGFKKVDVDVEIVDHFSSFIFKKFRILIIRIFSFDISAWSIKRQIKSRKHILSGYEVVQLINEAPFDFHRKHQKIIFDWLREWNQRIYLLSAGLDYTSVSYAYNNKFRYSILTPYFEKKGSKKDFSPALSYLTRDHLDLHKHIFEHINGVISNDLDYHLPLFEYEKYLGMIPHAINTSHLQYSKPQINGKIIIFHGINTFNYFKKGNDLFDKSLEVIKNKYFDKVEIIRVKNLSYKEYINSFNRSHILLDQVYAYDQGYNALEAMAKGKVVFTGAEQEWLDYYELKEDTVAINALPEVEYIVNKLEWLILNPAKIEEISKNARLFIEKEHNYKNCARQYITLWSNPI